MDGDFSSSIFLFEKRMNYSTGNELAGAFEAYEKALQVDPEHQASIDAIDRVTTDNRK